MATVGGFLPGYSCNTGTCHRQTLQSLQVRAVSSEDEEFEARLARIQRKVGKSGKKAALRKASKEGGKVLLPPVPLQDPVSDGLPVELGFNSYTERLNGRFAALGLAALILVELATGSSFIKYHEPAIIGIQAYTMLAIAALFIKYEKEKKSVWPRNTTVSANLSNNNSNNTKNSV